MMARASRLLVVTADADVAASVVAIGRERVRANTVSTGAEALKTLATIPFDVVVLDLDVSDIAPGDLARTIAHRFAGVPVVLVAAQSRVPEAIELVRKGAEDYLRKPVDAEELTFTVEKVLAAAETSAEEPPPSRVMDGEPSLIGRSEAMRAVLGLVDRAAKSNATVLVRGETGSGKELVARRVHELSPRARGPFLKVHCAALPEQLLESELFGYDKGAFTGAQSRKPGRVELAEGGTLFLDEIGDITPATQVKLLRVLQDRQYERLGGSETLHADVRFVTATHRNLEEMVARGQFREDLYYRINVIAITAPPLRQHAADVPELVRHFVHSICKDNGKASVEVAADAIELLAAYPWPGNVRQLENVMERLVILTDSSTVAAPDVRAELARIDSLAQPAHAEPVAATTLEASAVLLDDAVRKAERRVLEKALKNADGNRTVAARILGISRRSLYYKLEEHGLGG
jgi:two-component system response regulator AtoC